MKLKNIIVALLIGASLHSCDYLDIVPDDTPILADAFKNEQTAENFVFACYSFIPNYLNFRQNFSWCTTPETVGSAPLDHYLVHLYENATRIVQFC